MESCIPSTDLATFGEADLCSVRLCFFVSSTWQWKVKYFGPGTDAIFCADVNTEIDNLKHAIVKMLKAGQPVFFGCDVGKFSDTPAGIMDLALYEYEVRES